MKPQSRALAKFSIVVDQTDKPYGPTGPAVPVRAEVCLYRTADGYEWRMGGPRGDPVGTLPIVSTVAQAKRDARAAYDTRAWQMQDKWA